MESVHLYVNTNEYFGEVDNAEGEMVYNDFMSLILLTNTVKGIHKQKRSPCS